MNFTPVVLVTGSSRGLGRGVAETLAKSGYSVAIHYGFNRASAEAAVAACRALAVNENQQFAMVGGDISKKADRDSMLEQTLAAFGRLDALVNNAGIAPKVRADITEATEESFDDLINTNLKGPYFLSQSVVNYWLKNPGASAIPSGYKLLFVTSISADTASPNRGDYCISKAGLAMASQLWATRLAAEGIQVMELRPGIMATDMTSGVKGKYDELIANGLVPQKRWGTPEDVGLAVKAILDGGYPFSTGSVVYVDGGFHLRRL
jgi:NAD(P)-dependent dehydrogenase (short-subunit alcohol dehydrogenase family)